MWVFEHVADGGLSFEVIEAEPGARCKLGNVYDFNSKFLSGLAVEAAPNQRERTLSYKNEKMAYLKGFAKSRGVLFGGVLLSLYPCKFSTTIPNKSPSALSTSSK